MGAEEISGRRRCVENQLMRSQPSCRFRDWVAIPFMVREPHHERNYFAARSTLSPFALTQSMGLD